MGFASAGAGVAKGAAISARTVARLNAKVTMKPVASATSTPRLATAQAPVLPPCWARIHDCGDDLRHHAAVWGLSCGDVGARTSEIQRLGKALESAGIKLGSVASELTGKSATALIEALVDGGRRGGGSAGPADPRAGCYPVAVGGRSRGRGGAGGAPGAKAGPGDPGWPGSASDPLPGTDACARRCVLFVVVSCSWGSFCLGVSRLVKSGCADVSCH